MARRDLQNFAALFGLLLGPEFMLFAIPVRAQTATMAVTIPATASTLRIFPKYTDGFISFQFAEGDRAAELRFRRALDDAGDGRLTRVPAQ